MRDYKANADLAQHTNTIKEEGNKSKASTSNHESPRSKSGYLFTKSRIVQELLSPLSKSKTCKLKLLLGRSRGLGVGLPGSTFEFGLKGSV